MVPYFGKFNLNRLVDLSDVGKIVTSKGEPLPCMGLARKIYNGLQKHSIPYLLKFLNEYKFLATRTSAKFSTSFAEVG